MIYFNLFRKIFKILNKDEKLLSLLILILTFISIIFETFGIATFFPLINSVVNENYFDNPFYKRLSEIVGIERIDINIFFIFFISFFILKNFYLIFYNYIVTFICNKISLRLTSGLFNIYLNLVDHKTLLKIAEENNLLNLEIIKNLYNIKNVENSLVLNSDLNKFNNITIEDNIQKIQKGQIYEKDRNN